MHDDSNLNKNEFTAVVSFAVNFHIFQARLLCRDPVHYYALAAARLTQKDWEMKKKEPGASEKRILRKIIPADFFEKLKRRKKKHKTVFSELLEHLVGIVEERSRNRWKIEWCN